MNKYLSDLRPAESGAQKREKDTLLIVGAGGFGRVVLEYAEPDYECAFIDDNVQLGQSLMEFR